MKKYFFISFVILLFISGSSYGWGRRGHDAIAYIAECNLTNNAKNIIEKYLGHSIVYYASWMDEYRNTPTYKQTTFWHTAAVDRNLYYTDSVRSPKGDAVCELENAIAKLKNYKQLDDSTVIVNLKYIIHLVGDMHCPVHIHYQNIKIGFKVKLLGVEYPYHKVWDSVILESMHNWDFLEYQNQLDRYSQKEKFQLAAGTPREWFHESAVYCRCIYDMAHPGDELGKDFLNAAHPIAETQLIKAGYRLARILNELFG